MLQFYPAQHSFVNRPLRQVTESARMAIALLTKLLLKSLSLFIVETATRDTITTEKHGIHNTVVMNMASPAPRSAQNNDGTDQNTNAKSANHQREEN